MTACGISMSDIHSLKGFSSYSTIIYRPAALALLREMSTAFAHHLHQMQELLQDIQLTQEHEGGLKEIIKTSAVNFYSDFSL